MKKILAIFLACMMILSTLPAVVLAEDVVNECKCDPNGRTGTKLDSVAATCVSVAYDVYVCNACNLQYTVVTGDRNNDHNPGLIVKVDAKAPTCENVGWEAYEYCAASLGDYECPYTTYVEIPATGHNWESVVTDPTCEAEGYTTYTCKNDPTHTRTGDTVDALGHDYTTVVTKPTCTEQGYTTYTCKNDPTHTYVSDYVPALNHTNLDPVIENKVDADCDNDGSYDSVVYCGTCGTEISRTPTKINATGHNMVEVERVEINEHTDGYIKYECSNGCGKTEIKPLEANKDHDYVLIATNDATCLLPAQEVWKCTVCDYELTIDVEGSEALGHHEVVVPGYAATCTTDGLTDGTRCDRCNETLTTGTVIPAHHTQVENVPAKAATCCEKGYSAHQWCSACDTVLGFVAEYPINPNNHTALEQCNGKDETCTHVGWKAYEECDDCGYTTYTEIPADPTKHVSYTIKDRVEPTCVAGGWTHVLGCSECNQVIATAEPIPVKPDAHHYSGVVTKPTCTEKGYTTYTCDHGCGATYVDDYVPQNGHKYTANVTAPTCTTQGYTTYTCSVCGYAVVYDYVPALGHTPATAVEENRKDADCVNDGGYDTVVYCSVCKEELSRVHTVIPALGHTLNYVEAKAQTCTEIGWGAYEYCSVCDYTTYVEIPADGHTPGETVGYAKPTCTEQGYFISKCLVCGTSFKIADEAAPALGHNMIPVDAQAPTCENIGWDAYEYCDRCDLTGYVEKAAIGHNYSANVTDPTCTTEGYTTHTCANDATHTYVDSHTPALGHTPATAVEENRKPADCVNAGSYDSVVYCSVCGAEISRTTNVIPALGHTPATAVEENRKAPDCVNAGSYDSVVYCSVCGDEISRVTMPIAALGHTPEDIPAVDPTFDTTGLTKGSKCSVCGEILVAQNVVPVIDESVYFSYVVTGINGTATATNSGFVTLKVYLNVETDIARLWGVDLGINFGDELTLVAVNGSLFDNVAFTALDTANAANKVVINQTGSVTSNANKTLNKGQYLFAELTFKVADDFYAADTLFTVSDVEFAREDEANTLTVDFATASAIAIHVDRLGDADGDGKLNVKDAKEMTDWTVTELVQDFNAYNTVYDMNKDGVIDGDDFDLLRNAIAGNDDYLTT